MLKKNLISHLHSARRSISVCVGLLMGLPVGLLAGVYFFLPAKTFGAVATDTTAVRVTSSRNEGVTRFFVHNLERSEVTMTFDFAVRNLKGSVEFPYTATFKPGETEAFALTPVNSNEQWQYAYTNYYKLGSNEAEPDDYVYSLPYAPGRSYRVSQGHDGRFSHQGSNKYAVDWKMPEGTPIHAARGGLVVKIKSDSDKGGSSIKYDAYNNYVLIRHSDGTLGHYCHLQQDGVTVAPGEYVKAGDLIAYSGNTGFSSGPHLHFCVFITRDGRERISVPVKFRSHEGRAVTLVEGRSYRAPETPDEAIEVAEGVANSAVR